MTATPITADLSGELDDTPAKHHPHRWRLHRAGIVNVWHYHDNEFAFSGGRMILRGTNGSGKSRALEMLLPFLLDADRRKMDATLAGKVRLEDLMKAGIGGQTNRLGYLWLELERTRTDEELNADPAAGEHAYLTLGALVRFSTNTAEAKAWYFTTHLRVGTDLILLDADRHPLSREHLAELIGADRITDSPENHRERVRSEAFGLTGTLGRERFTGLVQLLHTLRSPDVGNRINEGKLPQILSDALPPLSETALKDAGDRLDGLSETREQQRRMEQALKQVQTFCDVYRRYAAAALHASATAAAAAAKTARGARKDATDAAKEFERLTLEHGQAASDEGELEGHVAELAATIEGIKESAEYRAGRDLADRARSVDGLASAAAAALKTAAAARAAEAAVVTRLDRDAADLVGLANEAAAQLDAARTLLGQAAVPAGSLPEALGAQLEAAVAAVEPVRESRDTDPQPTPRPTPQTLQVTPADMPAALLAVQSVAESAKTRNRQAQTRLTTARDLERFWDKVTAADATADEVEARLETEREEADTADDARDTAARHLASGWRDWTAEPTTVELLGAVDWSSTTVCRLLVDGDSLIGDSEHRDQAESSAVAPVPTLDELDRTANDAAQDRYTALAHTEADLKAAEATDTAARQELEREREQLLAAVDPEPDRAPWVTASPAGTVPLWKAIDFTPDTTAEERAGLEAALLAAGLLSAVVTADGDAVAQSGQVLISTVAPAAPHPLTRHLIAEPQASTPTMPAAAVSAVLERINIGAGHPTWVTVDGQWGNGPLRGAHTVPAARHIGASAREAARTERLAAIGTELALLDTRAEERALRRSGVAEHRTRLGAHVRTAPTTAALRQARTVAAQAHRQADKTDKQARQAREAAARLRTEVTERDTAHRSICDTQALPYDIDGLTTVVHATADAAQATSTLADRVQRLSQAHDRYTRILPELEQARERRATEEQDAEQAYDDYAREHATFAALQETIGKQAEEVRARLKAAETQHVESTKELKKLQAHVVELGNQAAGAKVTAKNLADTAQMQQEQMAHAAAALAGQLAVPGVHAAARTADATIPEPTGPFTDPAAVDAFVKAVLGTLDQRGAAVDSTALLRATSGLMQDLSGAFDVIQTISDTGLHLIELAGEGDRQPVAVSAAALAQKVADDARALTAREHDVFTRFVLGGVGDELGRRIEQARALIAAMNTSLISIRTSHGIGVKLRWDLREPAGSPIARIRDLVATSTAIRRPEDNDELISLLRQRVEEQLRLDETAGYATHLRNALDYRQWYHVDVIIVGPAPGQERRISSRAKLSQGETRFVSYVTLFAAADAYLSGLQHNDRALRLILLDDAFAKVDDRTIGELMGLLVKLDIDFAMTGHALWGTYPQVPALDVYEVRRAEGTSAVTTHVHWDGRSRHLRAAR